MANQIFPTKGNLLQAKKTLDLSILGYDLLDRKRNILVREMMTLIDKANELKDEVDNAYRRAYKALELANVYNGFVAMEASRIPIDNGISIRYRSVMGIDLPSVVLAPSEVEPYYGLYSTHSTLDYASKCFHEVKQLTVLLAEVENSVYRLAVMIKSTQKRTNSLKNIAIPQYTNTVKYISEVLEEKEREEFSRQKVIKQTKQKKGTHND